MRLEGTFIHCRYEDLREIILEINSQSDKEKIVQPPSKQEGDLKDELLSRKRVAEMLGISLPTLNVHTKKGLLIAYRIGGRVFYKKNEVLAALKKIRV